MTGQLTTSYLNTDEASGTINLPDIARGFTSTPIITLEKATATTLKIAWSTPQTCDSITLHCGSKTVTWSGSAKSGTITVTDLNFNTNYSVYGTFRRKDTQVSSNSQTKTFKTTKSQLRVRINGEWKNALAYVRVNGQWKEATPYVRINGQWKEGI